MTIYDYEPEGIRTRILFLGNGSYVTVSEVIKCQKN